MSNFLYRKSDTEKRILDILEKDKGRRILKLQYIPVLIAFVLAFCVLSSFVSFVGASDGVGAVIPDAVYSDAIYNAPAGSGAGDVKPEDIPDLWPVKDGAGSVSSYFGDMINNNGKNKIPNPGIDITDNNVMLVVASADGEVAGTGKNYILLRHKSGIDTYYGNLCVVSVINCQSVAKGELIGHCYTGRVHFELIKGNAVMDPMKILKSATS